MVPSRDNRPSTANTMLLVLKPRPVDFSPSTNVFMGSENEREAWRKNRVMQMKLRAYVTEVHQQQQSSARLLRTEEYRFLQEATRRSGVPKSVNMLDQLHFYRDKTFPGRRFSTDWHFRDGQHHPHHHKHPPPMSARPIRPHRPTALLNRPKTSATLYRKNVDDEDDEEEEDQTDNRANSDPYAEQARLNTKYQILIDSNGRHIANVAAQQRKVDLNTSSNTIRQNTPQFPPIRLKDNKENVQPVDNLKDSLVNLPRDIRTAPEGVERSNKFDNLQSQQMKVSDTNPTTRQRRVSSNLDNKNVSLSRMNSFIDPVSLKDIEKDVNNNNVSPEHTNNDPFGSSLTEEDFEKEMKNVRVTEFIEKHSVQELQKQQQFQQSQHLDDNEAICQGVSAQLIDNNLLFVDGTPEWQDQTFLPDQQPATTENTTKVAHPQKRLLRQNTKTNFNRIKNEPLPLRHNITSVLRQERTKYEASQKKVKDYLHNIGSKDNSSKHSNANSREPSAHGRKSALRKSTPNA